MLVKVKYDINNGGYYIEIPDTLLQESGLELGDPIEWADNGDNTFTIKKVEETEYVLVDCISSFRVRYMVEVPKGKKEWALDEVTMETAKEFSQQHIGETIVSHRVIPKYEFFSICNEDNEYAKNWTNETKIEKFLTKLSKV